MKKTYIQPEAAIGSVNHSGNIIVDPNPGDAGYSVETSEVNAKENDDVVVDDDDLSYSPMHTDWSTE